MMMTNKLGAPARPVEYLLYWTSPTVARQIVGNINAIRQLPLPYRCDELDEALGHARLRIEVGTVPPMIEGADGVILNRGDIERELSVRAGEQRARPRKF